jgi:hypothetical protein
MAGRQRTTFQKRQKEVKRLEKQRMKAEKRLARRQERAEIRAAAASEIPPPVPELNPNRP